MAARNVKHQAADLCRLWPGESTPTIGEEPDFTIEPVAFSTMFDSPLLLLSGALALRSTLPAFRE